MESAHGAPGRHIGALAPVLHRVLIGQGRLSHPPQLIKGLLRHAGAGRRRGDTAGAAIEGIGLVDQAIDIVIFHLDHIVG